MRVPEMMGLDWRKNLIVALDEGRSVQPERMPCKRLQSGGPQPPPNPPPRHLVVKRWREREEYAAWYADAKQRSDALWSYYETLGN